MVRVKVRVFTFPSDPREQNSFLVGTSEGGLLPVVGTVNVDDKEVDTVTFAQLRPRIELKNDNNMIRRTLMFQEVLSLIASSANPHGWPSSAMQTYWFGYFPNEDDPVPRVLSIGEEDEPVSKFLSMTTSKLTGDIVLVPQTQLGPVCEQCCRGCCRCPSVK